MNSNFDKSIAVAIEIHFLFYQLLTKDHLNFVCKLTVSQYPKTLRISLSQIFHFKLSLISHLNLKTHLTLSKFYQSNTRQDLQNQLKDLNFEDEEDEVNQDNITKDEEEETVNGTNNDLSEEIEIKKSELLSGSDEENEKEFKIESGGRDESTGEASDKGRKPLFDLK